MTGTITTLYPREFVESLPKPDAVETRPLLMLLRGEHSDAEAEIERIERWFRELDGPPERKAALAGNLRSLRSRNFWSALSELMTSRVLAECGCSPSFEAPVAGLTPDFFVRCPSRYEFVVEVLTAFEEEDYRRLDADLHYVANALAEVKPDPISLDTITTNPMMVSKEVGHELEATEGDDRRTQ